MFGYEGWSKTNRGGGLEGDGGSDDVVGSYRRRKVKVCLVMEDGLKQTEVEVWSRVKEKEKEIT